MKTRRRTEPPRILHTTAEAAQILGVATQLLNSYLRAGRHPEYVWKPHWREPRWTDQAVREWGFIVQYVSLADLPDDSPPLEHPARIFRHHSKPSRGAA